MPVLLVEDEFLIRICIADLLREAGFECFEAADAASALALLESADDMPDLLITDYNLGPGPNGMALAAEVLRRLPGLPVLFVTGNPECFDGRAWASAERLLPKPFRIDDLFASVEALMARGGCGIAMGVSSSGFAQRSERALLL